MGSKNERISLNDNKNRKKKEFRTLLFYVFIFFMGLVSLILVNHTFRQTPVVAAEPPAIITYQGKLLLSGTSVTSTKTMGFLLYDSLTGGNLLYTAAGTLGSTSTLNVSVSSGLFNVNLGDGSTTNIIPTSTFANNQALYLEVHVAGTVLTPRKRLTAAPYAINSQYLMGISATSTSSSTHIPHSDEYGNFTFSGNSRSSGVSGGILYINPTSSIWSGTLFGAAVNGSERLRLDANGGLWVASTSTLSGGFLSTASSTVNSSLSVSGALNASSSLFVANNFIINQTAGTFEQGRFVVDSSGNVAASGTLRVAGDVTFLGTCTGCGGGGGSFFSGMTTNTLFVTDGLTTSSLRADGLFVVTSTNNRAGLFSVDSSGNVAASGTQRIIGLSTLTGGFLSNASSTVNSYLSVSGVLNASSTLIVNGLSTLSSGFLSTGSSTVNGSLAVSGVLNASSTLLVSGNVGISSTSPQSALSVGGTVAITGTTTIEDVSYLKGKVVRPRHVGAVVDGGTAFLGGAHNLYVAGNYAYVTAYSDDGFNIIDISDPTRLRVVGSATNATTLNGATGVWVHRGYAYISNFDQSSISVFDVSNPSNPVFVTSTANGAGGALLTNAFRSFVQGNYLYVVANGDDALNIFDISNPTQLRFMGVISSGTTLDAPQTVYVSGRYAYVTTGGNTDALVVIDVSDPRRPQLAGSFSDGANTDGTIGIHVQGNKAYLGTGTGNRLYILDVSNPASITSLASISITGPRGIFVAGNYAYVASDAGTDALEIIDVSSSTNPLAAGRILDGDGGAVLTTPNRVVVQGNYAFVTAQTGNALEAIDVGGTVISNADIGSAKVSNLQVLNYALFDNGVSIKNGLSIDNNGLAIAGDFSMSVNSSSAYLINATNTLTFSHKALFQASSTNGENFIFDTANQLTSNNTKKVFSIRNNGTELITVAANANLGINTTTPDSALSVSGTAHITGTTTIDDITNIRGKVVKPRHVGQIVDSATTPFNNPYHVTVSGHYAYVASLSGDSLTIVDVSNPQRLQVVGSTSTGQYLNAVTDVEVVGNYAYTFSLAALPSGNLSIWDVSNPAKIQFVTSTPINLARWGAIQGNYLYMVAQEGLADNFYVYDISNPQNPQRLSLTSSTVPNPGFVTVSGRYAYLTSVSIGTGILQVIDISDPRRPVPAGRLVDTTNFDVPEFVRVQGRYAYLISQINSTFSIVDISNPRSPSLVSTVTNGGSGGATLARPYGLAVAGNYAYVTNWNSGANGSIQILDISSSTNPVHAGIIRHGDGGASLNGPVSIALSGNYAFAVDFNGNAFEAIDVGGVNISNADISQARVGTLQVLNDTLFDNGVVIKSGLTVGNSGLKLEGDFGMSVASSSGYLINATNTLSFSHKALFKASSTNAENFIFDTANTLTSNNTNKVLSVRNNGTELFNVYSNGGLLATASSSVNGPLNVSGALNASSSLFVASSIILNQTAGTFNSGRFFVDSSGNLSASGSIQFANLASCSGVQTNGQGLLSCTSGGGSFDGRLAGTSIFQVTDGTTTSTLTANSFSVATSSANGLGLFHIDASGNVSASGTINTTNKLGVNSSSAQFGLSLGASGTPMEAYITGTTTIEDVSYLKGKVTRPRHVASLADGTGGASLANADSIFVSGKFAYVTSFTGGALNIIDISNPQNPKTMGVLTGLTSARSIYVSGDYAYIGGSSRIHVIDVSNPAIPRSVTSTQHAGTVRVSTPKSIYVQGNKMYVADNIRGFIVYDISDPNTPRFLSLRTTNVNNGANDVVVKGRYAYIAASTEFTIYDVSDPKLPVVAGTWNNGGASFWKVTVEGNYAYLAENSGSRIRAFDVSNPAAPFEMWGLNNGVNGAVIDSPWGIAASGNYLYVSAGNTAGAGQLQVLDINSTTLVDSLPRPSGLLRHGEGGAVINQPRNLAVQGNYVYIAGGNGANLEIVDVGGTVISNAHIGSANISRLQVLNTAMFSENISISGGAWVGSGGLSLNGDFSMSVVSTSEYLVNATNTLSFSHKALFRASSTNGENFIFDAINTTTGANNTIFSIRDNGTKLFSVSSTGDVHVRARLFASSATVGTPGNPGDLAERVDIAADDTAEPGDVMIVDSEQEDTYRRSRVPYEAAVAGVISTNPTIVIGNGKTDYTATLAMVGRVPLKVSLENGDIHRGDLLVAAATPGHAMKYDANNAPTSTQIGIIGIALDTFTTVSASTTATTGKIMGLIRTGWVNNTQKSVTENFHELLEIATNRGTNLETSGDSLTVTDSGGNLTFTSGGTLDVGEGALVRVGSIIGKDLAWEIDERGRFITRVATAQGEVELFGVQSRTTEFIFSGSSALILGETRVTFDGVTQELIDPLQPIHVTVTLTDQAKGIYITDKNNTGFTARELLGGLSNATFDWTVRATRRPTFASGSPTPPPVEEPPTPPVSDESAPSDEPPPTPGPTSTSTPTPEPPPTEPVAPTPPPAEPTPPVTTPETPPPPPSSPPVEVVEALPETPAPASPTPSPSPAPESTPTPPPAEAPPVEG